MIETILGIVRDEMQRITIPYEFMRWTSSVVDTYWVGEYSETPTDSEDGSEEYTLILTGTARGEWLKLLQEKEKIKDHFPDVGGFRKRTNKGAVVIFYDQSFPVPTGEADLKKIQVNLQVKAWKGMNDI